MRAALIAAGAAGTVLIVWTLFGPIPPLNGPESTAVLDRNGVVLYEPLTARGDRSERIASVPPAVAAATIAAEDRRFMTHFGVDPLAIARAAWHDLRRLSFAEGGSTITQQVAKMLLAPDGGDAGRRGVVRKVHEAVIALRLERRYSKRAILALYVNHAPYGNQIRGIARASRFYFGCVPEDLTNAQAAFLAALPQRPGTFNPLRDPRRAAARQRAVLQRMRTLGAISPRQLEEARLERLRFEHADRPVLAQHFIERVLAAEKLAAGRGRVIHTTLDAGLQRTVAGIVAAHRDDLLRHNAHSVAVAVLDNATGEWLAWEGSGDYFGANFGGAIDGVAALRQPGSALKPFTYAVAFEQGLSPATVLPDVPSTFPTAEEGIVYKPRNYDGVWRGPLRARVALAGSENVPAVALLSRIGTASLLRFLRNAGFNDLTRSASYYGLGLTLGDPEVRLEQLIAAYSVFARGGVWMRPRMTLNATTRSRRVLSPRTAFWITDILSDGEARQYIFGSGGSLDFPFPVAVKTGTSQAYRDNWTVGYTRDVTVGVWVGNFDRSELRNSSGVTGAGPIFHDVMMAAAKPRPVILDPPADLERTPVCVLSGLRPSPACPSVESEWTARDAPVEFCSWHHDGRIDWPDQYRAWARSAGLLIATTAAGSERAPSKKTHSLTVINPPDGATYLIDPTLRTPFQAVRLEATATAPVTWSVDGTRVRAPDDGHVQWPLRPGRHTFVVTDGSGNRAKSTIVVR